MRLFHCLPCGDVLRLQEGDRFCSCGKSRGRLEEGDGAAILVGPCAVIGIGESDLTASMGALQQMVETESPGSTPLRAWLISPFSSTVKSG